MKIKNRIYKKYLRPIRVVMGVMVGCLILLVAGVWDTSHGQVLQQVGLPSSPNPVGSGARAIGMGGAFIAIADDATAASWNPGGLVHLEFPEVSIVGAGFNRNEDLTFGTNPEASGDQAVSTWRINYLSAAYPFSFHGYGMVVSVNYQNLYDFSRKGVFSLSIGENELSINQTIDSRQDGALSAIGLAYCIMVTPTLSLGLTLNVWEDGINDNGWQQVTRQTGTGTDDGEPFVFEYKSVDQYAFNGLNTNFGVLWRLNSNIILGGVVKTPFKADIDRETSFFSLITHTESSESGMPSYFESTYHESLNMPMSYGIGAAYRFSDSFTISMDIYRTLWDDFIYTDFYGNKVSPITGMPADVSDIKPTCQFRLGSEYLFLDTKYIIPLRWGLFYDPAPAKGRPDDYFGISLGTGVVLNTIIFDTAFQYRFGRDTNTSIMENYDFSLDLDEYTFYTSIIFHL